MKKNSNINWWKWGFLLLLALNLAFCFVIGSRLIQIREPETEQIKVQKQKAIKVGTINSNRQQLNQTVASFLKDNQTKDLTYNIYAGSSSIIFEGKYKLLGYEVPLYVYFQPIALANGNVQLHVSSISAGTLPLPESEVLQYVKSSYDLPKFVTVNAKKSSLMIDLGKIRSDTPLFLKAKKLDLINDKISFDIYKKSSK
ncbi:YpmS family protein [Streptococcus pseudoporcinus]|uniref:Membrane protein n=2 Tax=Streptococcus pseudoporcinus TaxID=361101 RepID=A0A4U9XJW6_9STRE|nr:DUF2140 family protein [Streptococcus pseudoporcinus]EFR43961.1 hypothetical protein HMPREF9320_0472 [Streptococcus pseudoporcinus SPIN 20026]EHI65036.1 hypothetical protein STRPS_0443 [Streptococcus pseudoporcinus LQ 940-04]VEF93398.1 membrane protein [Streptococcus pseudoporcinus]VTS12768.1 membrane protein [Streptococcus pseudoporcinus]VTS32157.1 membrane protein [Streptococcus pseudoporcinus]